MPRDYAKTSSRNKKSGQLPGWVWMLGGLAIGLFVAFVVYLNNAVKPGQKDTIASVIKDTFSDLQENAKQRESTRPTQKEQNKTTKPETTKNHTKFDFYYILPEIDVPVPDQELERVRKNPVKHDKGNYILQVGSFRELAQADQLKAKLALKGLSANIQSVKINNNTWHRVRIGPINNITRLSETRRRLKQSGIHSIVVKNKS